MFANFILTLFRFFGSMANIAIAMTNGRDLPRLVLLLFSSHHSVLSQCGYGGGQVVCQHGPAGCSGTVGAVGWNCSTTELHLTLHGQQLGLDVWIVCL